MYWKSDAANTIKLTQNITVPTGISLMKIKKNDMETYFLLSALNIQLYITSADSLITALKQQN